MRKPIVGEKMPILRVKEKYEMKKCLLGFGLIGLLMLGGCGGNVQDVGASNGNITTYSTTQLKSDTYVYEVIDEDTGVHYMIVFDELYQKPSVSVTPMYNTDGSLKTNK